MRYVLTEKTVVAEKGDGGSSQGYAGGGFTGGADEEEISGKLSKSYIEQMGKRVR